MIGGHLAGVRAAYDTVAQDDARLLDGLLGAAGDGPAGVPAGRPVMRGLAAVRVPAEPRHVAAVAAVHDVR